MPTSTSLCTQLTRVANEMSVVSGEIRSITSKDKLAPEDEHRLEELQEDFEALSDREKALRHEALRRRIAPLSGEALHVERGDTSRGLDCDPLGEPASIGHTYAGPWALAVTRVCRLRYWPRSLRSHPGIGPIRGDSEVQGAARRPGRLSGVGRGAQCRRQGQHQPDRRGAATCPGLAGMDTRGSLHLPARRRGVAHPSGALL